MSSPSSSVKLTKRRTHRVFVGLAVNGILLRIVMWAVAAFAAFFLIPAPILRVLLLAGVTVGVVFPATMLTWSVLVCVPLGLLFVPPNPTLTAAAILVVHITHVLSTLILTIPATARVSLRALRLTGLRFLIVQFMAQAVGLLVVLIPREAEAGLNWLAPVGAGCLALLAVFALRERHRRQSSDDANVGRRS